MFNNIVIYKVIIFLIISAKKKLLTVFGVQLVILYIYLIDY